MEKKNAIVKGPVEPGFINAFIELRFAKRADALGVMPQITELGYFAIVSAAGDATSAHDTRRTEHADARGEVRHDSQLDGDAADRVDDTSAGRHSPRHDGSGAAGPDDTRGTRSPRTEEHTR